MKRPTPNKADQTRQFIIEKAAPVFNKKGYAGTSLSDLTKATGLTKGSIYGNFKNKDEVAIHAFRYNVEQIAREMVNAINTGRNCLEKLLAYPVLYRNIYRTIQAMGGCPVQNTAVEVDDTQSELKKLTARVIREWEEMLAKIVDEGAASGEFRADADGTRFAHLLIAMSEGGGMLAKITGSDAWILDCIDEMERIIRRLLPD